MCFLAPALDKATRTSSKFSDMISTAVIYTLLILVLILSPKLFLLTLVVMLLVYFFAPSNVTAQVESVLTNLTWLLLAIVILLIILALVFGSYIAEKVDFNSMTSMFTKMY